MKEFKLMHDTKEADGGRTLTNIHGLLVLARVHGKMRFFGIGALLQVLTTAMALLAASQIITNTIMLYMMSDSDKFKLLKFQPTQKFSELRLLQAKQKEKLGERYDELEYKP